jgi:hypothetical protein
MREIKEICAVLLDEPEPPLRAGEEVFTRARRATRRRTLLTAGTAAAALTAVAATALIAPGAPAGSGVVAGPSASQPADRAPDMMAAARTVLPDLPTAEQIQAHGDEIYRILFAAVPPGYQAERRFGDGDNPSLWFIGDGSGGRPDLATAPYTASADLVVRADGREGGLAATVWADRQPAPTGDLCSPQVDARMNPIFGPAESCQVITIGGLPMRVITQHDAEELAVIHATWFVRNGFVTVSSRQGLRKYQPDTHRPSDAPTSGGLVPTYRPPLQGPLFTARELAVVAANPDLLP